jgi:hypothetical protein
MAQSKKSSKSKKMGGVCLGRRREFSIMMTNEDARAKAPHG